MAVWIFPKKIESIASISRKMMGVSSHTWIVSFMICGRDFPQEDDLPRWRSGLPPEENLLDWRETRNRKPRLSNYESRLSTRFSILAMTWSFPEKTDPSRHSVRFGAQEVDERNAKLLQTLSEATDMLAKADEMQVIFGGLEGERCVFFTTIRWKSSRSSGGTWMIFRRSCPHG